MSHLSPKAFSQTCQTSSQRMSTVTATSTASWKTTSRDPQVVAAERQLHVTLIYAGWSLQITTWYHWGQRPNVTYWVLFWQAEQGTGHLWLSRQSRVTTSPLLQHKAEGHCPGSDVSATAGSCSLLNSFPLPAVVLAQLMSIIFTLTLILYLLV